MEEREINNIFKTGKILLITTLIFLIITIGLIGGAMYLRIKETSSPRNLGELIENYEDKEGEYVKINLAYLPYGFAEEDESRYYYFAMDSENYMYIVRITDETYDELVKLSDEGKNQIEYELKGYTFDIPTDLKRLAVKASNEVFEDTVITTSNIDDYVGSVYIDETDVPSGDTIMTLCGIAIFGGIFTIILGITLISQKLRLSKITKNKELMEDAKLELENLTDNPYKKLKVYLTNKYIISKTGGLSIIQYKDVIWEYSLIRYVNGIAQSKSLMLCTKDKKKLSLAVGGANDSNIDEIMVEIKDKNDNVRIGYTKENREFYKNYQKELM